MNEEEYYEVLREARDAIPNRGLEYIFCRMVKSNSDYIWKYSYPKWLVGPWLQHHHTLWTLEVEYGDE